MLPFRADILVEPIGDGLVIARHGSRRLYVLNEAAAVAWRAVRDLRQGDEALTAVTQRLEERFGIPASLAREEAQALLATWDRAGDAYRNLAMDESVPPDWVIPPATTSVLDVGQLAVGVGGLAIAIDAPDAELRGLLARHLQCLTQAPGELCRHVVRLSGDAAGWSMTLNGTSYREGRGADHALVETVVALCDLAARAEDRLLVVHGAGLARADGHTALLIAPSGHGKTTLATALNARGLALLSDDVVPIDRSGRPVALGLPICVKSGSWAVLSPWRSDLVAATPIERMGEPVRFLPPLRQAVRGPLRASLLLFPSYEPGSEATIERLAPERVLQLVVEAQSIIRDITSEKLRELAAWLTAVPAYALRYPDLSTAVSSADELIGSC